MKIAKTLLLGISVILIPLLTGLPRMSLASADIIANTEQKDEHVVWIKTPIQFVLPVGKERMLSFPQSVELINHNPLLTTKKVTMYNNHGTLYITAHQSFSEIVLPVRLIPSGIVVLVKISSDESAQDDKPLDVVIPTLNPSAYQQPDKKIMPTVAVNAVSLMRFAAQQFSYARLASHPSNIVRTPMYTHKVINIYAGDQVIGYPLASWRGGDLYVSVVEVKNVTTKTLTLHPEWLKGDWQAATFYRFDTMKDHDTPVLPFQIITSQGSQRDFTLLIVVSDRPFGQALQALPSFARRIIA